MKRIIGALIASAVIGVGGVALTAPQAHASYAFPAVSVIDTQRQSCNKANPGDPVVDCYTWIRTNGVLRRGSPAEYFSEAQGGFVAVLCSQALYFTQQPDQYGADYNGNTAKPGYYHWFQYSNNGYCLSPVKASGPYAGYNWSMLPNANLQ